jgi:hypothetical protein
MNINKLGIKKKNLLVPSHFSSFEEQFGGLHSVNNEKK